MKQLLIAIALGLAVLAAHAQEEPVPEAAGPAPAAETAAQADDRGARLSAADEGNLDDDALKQRVRGKVLKFVDTILESAGDEITEEQKREILEELEAEFDGSTSRRPKAGLTIDIRDDGGSDESALEMLVPILAITLTFGTPILVVIAVLYAGYRKRRLLKETISEYLASGRDVPPEILENLQGGARPKNYLQKGLVMAGAGIGIISSFAMIGSTSAAALGLIPLFIGLAQLLIWKMERDDEGAKE